MERFRRGCSWALAGYLVLAAGVVLALFSSWQQTERLRTNICDTLHRSEVGLPANPYFREHPERLRLALRDVHNSQRDLRCN